jgi:hypothetical protein
MAQDEQSRGPEAKESQEAEPAVSRTDTRPEQDPYRASTDTDTRTGVHPEDRQVFVHREGAGEVVTARKCQGAEVTPGSVPSQTGSTCQPDGGMPSTDVKYPFDHLIPLTEAAKKIPGRRPGKAVSRSTLERWRTRGVRGVVLRTVRVGATVCTCHEWVREFLERLNAPRAGEPPPQVRSLSQRERAAARARQQLEAAWRRQPRPREGP